MKKLLLIALIALSSVFAIAQPTWNNFGDNLGSIALNPKIVYYNDTAFVAYRISSTEGVFKKNIGSNWVTLGTYIISDGCFDIEGNSTTPPVVSYLRKSPHPTMSTSHQLDLLTHKYENGIVSLIEQYTIFSSYSNSHSLVHFDFALSPGGGYGFVFRYNNTYNSYFLNKALNSIWESLIFNANGNSSGVINSKLCYTSKAAYIFSRNANSAGGPVNAVVYHAYFVENATANSSIPTSSQLANTFARYSDSNIDLVASGDSVYTVIYDPDVEYSRILKTVLQPTLSANLADISTAGTIGVNEQCKIQINNNNDIYIALLDAGDSKVYKYSKNSIGSYTSALVGNSNLNDASMVGDLGFCLGKQLTGHDEIFAFYQFGPPFNNAKVRKFGCSSLAIPLTYNAVTNNISPSSPISNALSYEWVNCSQTSSVIATTESLTPTVNGAYQLTANLPQGCVSQSPCFNITLCSLNNSVTLSGNTLNAAQSGATYQWVDCNNSNAAISGATNQNFTPTVTGNYAVQLTTPTCTALIISACTSVTINSTVGINEKNSNLMQIFPNPAKDVVTISNTLPNVTINITNALGQIIYTESINGTSTSVNVSHIQNGVYFIRFEKENRLLGIEKIVIQK